MNALVALPHHVYNRASVRLSQLRPIRIHITIVVIHRYEPLLGHPSTIEPTDFAVLTNNAEVKYPVLESILCEGASYLLVDLLPHLGV